MEIDNSPQVVKDRKIMYGMVVGLIVLITAIMLADIFDQPLFKISREYYVLAVAVIYVLANIYRFLLDLNYFNYSDQGGKILIKYYSLRPFMQKYKTIEITRGSLVKYEIKKLMLGRKKQIILFQKIKNKIAKYPPISISALNKEEINTLIKSLDLQTLQKN